MAKSPKGPGDRKSSTAKAGKRSGAYIDPPAAKSDRRAAREQGEQQFTAKAQQYVTRSKTVIVFDKALRGYVYRDRPYQISADYTMDASRGRVVSSPKFQEAK